MSAGSRIEGSYRVTVYYREPTYELTAGRKAEPYRWTFEIEAPSAEVARRQALREFDDLAQASSVGWIRRVVHIETQAVLGLCPRLA